MNATGIAKEKQVKHQWTAQEDKVLVECLLELTSTKKWKADNGTFRAGYTKQLEKWMNDKLPNNCLKATPHIESRVKTMKKKYAAVAEMLGPHASGFSWNDKENMIVVERSVFQEWVKSHPSASGLYGRPFPHYEDLAMIFGKGEFAEEPLDISAQIEKETEDQRSGDRISENTEPNYEPWDEYEYDMDAPLTLPNPIIVDSNASQTPTAGRSRKRGRMIADTLESFVGTVKHLGEIFKHEKETADRRMQVADVLLQIEGLTNAQRVRAGFLITKHGNLTDYFFSLAPELRKELVNMLLENLGAL